jgi:hypothetical protein
MDIKRDSGEPGQAASPATHGRCAQDSANTQPLPFHFQARENETRRLDICDISCRTTVRKPFLAQGFGSRYR